MKPPVRISDEMTPCDVTGHFLFFTDGHPHPITIEGDSDPWIAVFSTTEKLRAFCEEVKITNYTIKQITNHSEFLASVVPKARVAVDLHRLPNGKCHWCEPISSLNAACD